MSDDLAAFIERLELGDGRPLELQPWQRAIVEGRLELATGTRLASRRCGRRRDSIEALVLAAMLGEDVTIASVDRRAAEELLEAARAEVERLTLHSDQR